MTPFQRVLATNPISITEEKRSDYLTLETYASSHSLDEGQCARLLAMYIGATEANLGENLSLSQIIKNFERQESKFAMR
jgi:hypothetical protein